MRPLSFAICASTIALIGASLAPAPAAAPRVPWANTVGDGAKGEWTRRLTVDASGNVYVTGYFPRTNTVIGTNWLVRTNLEGGAFLAKFDQNGSNVWARHFGGTEGDAVAVDADGNVYVSGMLQSDVSWFGPTNLVLHADSWADGVTELFLAKYDAAGDFQWVRQIWGAQSSVVYEPDLCVRGANIYLTAVSHQGFNFGGLVLSNTVMTVARYDPAGNLLSAYDVGRGPALQYWETEICDFCLDPEGGIYIAGGFGNEPFVLGETTLHRTSPYVDGLLTKWDANGNLLWFQQCTAEQSAGLYAVRPNPNGEITVLGGAFPRGNFAGRPVTNAFLARLSADGAVRWVKSFAADSTLFLFDLTTDAAGNSFVCGSLDGTEFEGFHFTNDAAAGVPIIAKLDDDGAVVWIKTGIPLSTNGDCDAWSIELSPDGALYVSGRLRGDFQFDSSVVRASGREDTFLLRLDPELPSLAIRCSGSSALVSWPANQPAFVLEHSSSSAGEWQPVTNPVARLGPLFVVTNTMSGSGEFFRLKAAE